MEYRAVILTDQHKDAATVMATEMSLAESTKYPKIIESFDEV